MRAREEAAAYGEALAGRRLEAGQRSGRAAAWDEVHERNAARLLALCIANGGVYVKLGQHAAQLDYLLPPQDTRTLHQLFEHNRASSYEDVSRVIEEELGAPPSHGFRLALAGAAPTGAVRRRRPRAKSASARCSG